MPRLLFVVLLSVSGFAQTGGQVNIWIPHGPEGGRIGRPVIDPQNPGTIYATAGGRLYQTTDAAGHWNDLGVPSVTILAVDPRNSNTLYGANNNTLYKSTDVGLTWSKPGPGLPGPCGPLSFSFVIDPSNTSTLYAGCQGTNLNGGGGLFKSMDGGATWNAASSGLPAVQAFPTEPWPPNVRVNALAIDPVPPGSRGALRHRVSRERTLYAAIGANVSYGGGLFQSTDGAASWNAVNSGLPDSLFIDAVALDPQNPNTLYVAGNTGVFRSTDGAASWTRAGNVSNVWNLAVDPLDSGSVFALNDRGILKSTDAGASWSVVSPEGTASDPYPWLVGWVVVAPGKGGPSTVYAGGNARGVFKSLDGGATWTLSKSGLFATSIYSLAIDPQNPQTVYIGVDVAGLYRSMDGAVSWSATGNLPGVSVFALANDRQEPGTFYASSPNGLYKSIDGGASWVQLPVAPALTDLAASYFPLAVDTRNPGTVYSGGFKSTDGGASWAKLALSPTALAIDPQDSGTLYAGTIAGEPATSVLSISGGVRKSVDGGRSWSVVNTVGQSYGVSSLTVDPTNSRVVYGQTTWVDCSESYDCSDGSGGNSGYGDPNSDLTNKGLGLFRSADGGATWAKLDLPGDLFQFQLLGVGPQGTLYARATAGLVRSMDGGATWNALPTAGLSSAVSVLAFDPQNPNHLFAGTNGGGLFEITLEQDE